MNKDYYLNLVRSDKRMAFAADLVIKLYPDYEQILTDGERLGQCIVEATKKYSEPLGLPYMDLKLEKEYLLTTLGIPAKEIDKFHFKENLVKELSEQVQKNLEISVTSRMKATCEAIAYLKKHSDYLPVGMCIGPFSLMTKLLNDPISAVFMSSVGVSTQDDIQVRDVEIVLDLCTSIIEQYLQMQIEAGAKAIVVCEPAANTVYISPDTLNNTGEDSFDRYVIAPNRQMVDLMKKHDVDLFLHDCGELNLNMIRRLCLLQPKILSLGSSVLLWEAAEVIPEEIILFGNLPTRKFFMDGEITIEQVRQMTRELTEKMSKTKKPYIIGSECDVLHINGHAHTIEEKLQVMFSKP